jgi:hypothetical protein
MRKKFTGIILVILQLCIILVNGQYSVNDLSDDNPEAIINKTYAEEQTALQNAIFKTYNRRARPLQNQSLPITVEAYIYLMHFSVDESQQTLTLNGHIYLSWIDEVAVWDPSKFNNIRNTLAKQWELWQPDLKVANSVSGVNQFFEISRRSHATLESISPTSTKVQTYPTFLMKIGCHFDYSNYPYDIQKCSLRLYPAARMNEVILKVYYELSPSVLLGWGEEAENKHIGEWNLLSVDNNITYFRKRKFSNERPPNAFEASRTWSIFMVYVTLERHVALYWVTMGLPAIISSIFNIFSFLFEKPENAIMVTIGNIFFQIVFLQDFIRELPPAVGEAPPIVRFANALLLMTIIAMLAHLFIKKLKNDQSKLPPKYSRYIYNGLEAVKKRGKTIHSTMQTNEEGHEEIEVSNEFTSFGPQNDKPLMMHYLLRGFLISLYTLLTFFLCLYYLW